MLKGVTTKFCPHIQNQTELPERHHFVISYKKEILFERGFHKQTKERIGCEYIYTYTFSTMCYFSGAWLTKIFQF